MRSSPPRVGLPWILGAALSGCGPDGAVDTGRDGDAPDEGEWSVSAPAVCETPVAAHWTDHSTDVVWDGSYYEGQGSGQMLTDTACVSLERREDAWVLWSTGMNADLHRYDLSRGDHDVYATSPFSQSMVVSDFDADGIDDVSVFLVEHDIVWGDEGVVSTLPTDFLLSFAAAAPDLDGDGLPDLVFAGGGDPQAAISPPQVIRNLGNRNWAPPTLARTGAVGFGFSMQVLDWDVDGDPDVYQCNDFGATSGGNVVLRNDDGALVAGDWRGADVVTSCMSAAFGDVDRDGTLDTYLAVNGDSSLLLDLDGFVDVSAARLNAPPRVEGQMGWSGVITDGDNDGLPDVFVSTGDFSRNTLRTWPVWWMRQQDDGTFVDEGAAAGLPQTASPRGLIARDLNEDGVVDFIVADVERPPWVLESDGCTADNWVEVTAPPGSKVTVEAGGHTWAALASQQDGWCGWAPPTVHVGLGSATTIDRITVRAPWHAAATIVDVPVRTRLTWTPAP